MIFNAKGRMWFWMMLQTSVYLMFSDDSLGIMNLQELKCDLPCSTELWEATKSEWSLLPSAKPIWFPSALATLLEGDPILDEDLSEFGVVALLGAIVTQIAMYERLNWYKSPCADQIWTSSILNTLHAWEVTWRRHPHANPNPFGNIHGPLLADAVPLLNTAYFHIYAPRTLRRIKEYLESSVYRAEMTCEEFNAVLIPQSEIEREMLFRAATHAAHSLHIRARLGYNLVARASCLDTGFHYGYTGFESGTNFSG